MTLPTPQTCEWCMQPFVGSDCLGKPCSNCRDQLQIKARGVVRDAENPKALTVMFDREPTDDELRAIHEYISMVGLMIDPPKPYELKRP